MATSYPMLARKYGMLRHAGKKDEWRAVNMTELKREIGELMAEYMEGESDYKFGAKAALYYSGKILDINAYELGRAVLRQQQPRDIWDLEVW